MGPSRDREAWRAGWTEPTPDRADFVPATTSVRRNRVRNVATERLERRAEHLRQMIDVGATTGGRLGFTMRAAELQVIERELERRRLAQP